MLDNLSIDVPHPRGLHSHLGDHVADEDEEGDGEGDHESLVDKVGCDEGGLDLGRPLLLQGIRRRLLLAIQQRVDLLTIVDFLSIDMFRLSLPFSSIPFDSLPLFSLPFNFLFICISLLFSS